MILALGKIRTDGGTQPRDAVNLEVVDAYRDAMREGAQFPPVDVFYDGTDYWLADGFHRLSAASQANRTDIDAAIHQGTVADARWFSYGANKTNGLFRSNADKQRAVKAALAHEKAATASNRQIAEHCGVAEGTIRNWRAEMTAQVAQSKIRTGRDGRTIKTANIGKSRVERKPKPVAVKDPQPAEPSRQRQSAPQAIQEVMTPARIIKALRDREHDRIRDYFIRTDSLVAAYVSAMTMEKLRGTKERIEFLQFLGGE